MPANLDTKYFKENPGLLEHLDELKQDLQALGVTFFNGYSTCCSTCGVNKDYDNTPNSVAYKLFGGGMNSTLETYQEGDDELEDYAEGEADFFKALDKCVVAYNYEDLALAQKVCKVLEKYFNVEGNGTLDKLYTITPKREPTPCKVLEGD